jgi:hypothetical protein
MDAILAFSGRRVDYESVIRRYGCRRVGFLESCRVAEDTVQPSTVPEEHSMNRHVLIAVTTAISLLGAASAFAGEATQDAAPASSTLSRAEVRAALDAARADGALGFQEASPAPQAASTAMRAQVAAEAREARRLGLDGWNDAGQPFGSPAEQASIGMGGLRAI